MWNYTEKVMNHFLNPRNVGEIENADAVGEVGNISCGDALKLTLKLDGEGRIVDAKFKTFGCASAIASSSALTEMVKGMTLEEALQLTNKDIVEVLGELPEEKMHCSVMGMEALQAAIANYRGETPEDSGDDHEGRIVCHCFGVTDAKIRRVAKENNIREAEQVTNYCKAGGGCGTCLDDIQEILDGLWRADGDGTPAAAAAATAGSPAPMNTVQKVLRVQEVLEKDIAPELEKDGGGVELVDIKGDVVQVRLRGHCRVCANAKLTLRNLVEARLREYVSPLLSVESVEDEG